MLIIAASLIYNSYRDFHSHPNIACRIKSTPALFTQRKHMRYGIVKEQYQYRCSPLSLFVSISSAVDFPSQTLNMRHGSLRTSPYRGNYSSGPAHRKDVEKEGYRRLDAQKDHYIYVSMKPEDKTNLTYIVKQSAMKATATGLMFIETSSGMGGASFRLPSL